MKGLRDELVNRIDIANQIAKDHPYQGIIMIEYYSFLVNVIIADNIVLIRKSILFFIIQWVVAGVLINYLIYVVLIKIILFAGTKTNLEVLSTRNTTGIKPVNNTCIIFYYLLTLGASTITLEDSLRTNNGEQVVAEGIIIIITSNHLLLIYHDIPLL